MAAASRCGFPVEQLMFELTEGERVRNLPGLAASFKTFKCYGFTSAIDDFGAAYAGFELLAAFQPDIVKVDISLVRSIDLDRGRRALASALISFGDEMDMTIIAEGIETATELETLRELGVRYGQGYHLAEPAAL